MFKEALMEADKKDDEFKKTGRAEGDFWGLPSCFKGTSNISLSTLAVKIRALRTDMDQLTDKQIITLWRGTI